MTHVVIVMALTHSPSSQVKEVDQHVDHFKLRGAVTAEAYAGIGRYEDQNEDDIVLVSDAAKEMKDDELDPLLVHQQSKL